MAKQQRKFKTSTHNSTMAQSQVSNEDDNLNVEDIVLEMDSTNFVNHLLEKEMQAAGEEQKLTKLASKTITKSLFPKSNDISKTIPKQLPPNQNRTVYLERSSVSGSGVTQQDMQGSIDLSNKLYDTGELSSRRHQPYHHNKNTAVYSSYTQDTVHKFSYESKFFKLPILAMANYEEEQKAKLSNEQTVPSGRGKKGKRIPKPVTQQAYQEPPQPLIKEWFSRLSVEERVACLTTIDNKITKDILFMINQSQRSIKRNTSFEKEKRAPWYLYGMFVYQKSAHRMHLEEKEGFQIMQRVIGQSDQHKVLSEMTLLENIRFTDTSEQHDTLTITQALVEDPNKFYKIGLALCGSNFLKIPYDFKIESDKFQTNCPCWFNPKKLFPVAYFIMFILERALWLQHEAHCKQPMRNEQAKNQNFNQESNLDSYPGDLINQKDKLNQPIFIPSDASPTIQYPFLNFRNQILPYWQQFCLQAKPVQGQPNNNILLELIHEIKVKAKAKLNERLELDKVPTSKPMSWQTGGISADYSSHFRSQVDDLKIKQSIHLASQQVDAALSAFAKAFTEHQRNNNEQNHLNELCMTHVKQLELSEEHHMVQRILVDTLLERQKASVQALVGPFTSTNKKLQKKKLKKKQKQQQEEAKKLAEQQKTGKVAETATGNRMQSMIEDLEVAPKPLSPKGIKRDSRFTPKKQLVESQVEKESMKQLNKDQILSEFAEMNNKLLSSSAGGAISNVKVTNNAFRSIIDKGVAAQMNQQQSQVPAIAALELLQRRQQDKKNMDVQNAVQLVKEMEIKNQKEQRMPEYPAKPVDVGASYVRQMAQKSMQNV